MSDRRTIAFVLFDQALALNLNGPAEAFSVANHLLAREGALPDAQDDSRGTDFNLFGRLWTGWIPSVRPHRWAT